MTRSEFEARWSAAWKRASKADPASAGVVILVHLAVVLFFKPALSLCVGLGVVSAMGWSLWFGPLVAVGVAQTFGWLWGWYYRRDYWIAWVEKWADDTEQNARGGA